MKYCLAVLLAGLIGISVSAQQQIRLDQIPSLSSGIPKDLLVFGDTPYICGEGGVWKLENDFWNQINTGISGENGIEFAHATELFVWNDALHILKANGNLMRLSDNHWSTVFTNFRFFDVVRIGDQLFAYGLETTGTVNQDASYQLMAFSVNDAEPHFFDIYLENPEPNINVLAHVNNETVFTTDGTKMYLIENNEVNHFSNFSGAANLIALDSGHLFIQNNNASWHNGRSHLLTYENGYWEEFQVSASGYDHVLKTFKNSEGLGFVIANYRTDVFLVDQYYTYSLEFNPIDTLLSSEDPALNTYTIAQGNHSEDVAFNVVPWKGEYLYTTRGGAVSILDYRLGLPNTQQTSTVYSEGFYSGNYLSAGEYADNIYALMEDEQQHEFDRILQRNSVTGQNQYLYRNFFWEDGKFLDFHLEQPIMAGRYGYEIFYIEENGTLDKCESNDIGTDVFDLQSSDYFPINNSLSLINADHGFYFDEAILAKLGNYCYKGRFTPGNDFGEAIAAVENPNSEVIFISEKRTEQDDELFRLWTVENNQFTPVNFIPNTLPYTHRKAIDLFYWQDKVVALVATATNENLTTWRYDYFFYDEDDAAFRFLQTATNAPKKAHPFYDHMIAVENGKLWITETNNLNWQLVNFTNAPEGTYFTSVSPEYNGRHTISTRGNGIYRTPGFVTSVNENTGNSFAMQVFPNPAHKQVQLKTPSAIKNLVVYNLQGQKVPVPIFQSKREARIQVFDLKSGVYFIHSQLEDGNILKGRFIKQ